MITDFAALNALTEVRSISEGRKSAAEIRSEFVTALPPRHPLRFTPARLNWREAPDIVAAARRRGWVKEFVTTTEPASTIYKREWRAKRKAMGL